MFSDLDNTLCHNAQGKLARVSWFQIFMYNPSQNLSSDDQKKIMQQAHGLMTHKVATNSRGTLQAGCMVVKEQTGHRISESGYQH